LPCLNVSLCKLSASTRCDIPALVGVRARIAPGFNSQNRCKQWLVCESEHSGSTLWRNWCVPLGRSPRVEPIPYDHVNPGVTHSLFLIQRRNPYSTSSFNFGNGEL
jgi:hypothetical protein